jgi:hypothetical protein
MVRTWAGMAKKFEYHGVPTQEHMLDSVVLQDTQLEAGDLLEESAEAEESRLLHEGDGMAMQAANGIRARKVG